MNFVERLYDAYENVDAISDPRVKDWWFVSNPVPTYLMSICYIFISWKVGPWLMHSREPFQLKVPLIIYNVAVAYLNFHIFKELLFGMTDAGYSYLCQPCTHDSSPDHMRIAKAIWWYYISKLIEFADTLFFVLRKKNNQISFLHVYHHSTMPMLWWIGTKWVPCGQSVHAAILNAFVHIVMYSYYGLSALGPRYQKYLWWKRYLTQMQLIQFCIAISVASYSLYIDCDFPRLLSWALIFYMISFLVLFGNFYLQAYIKKDNSQKRSLTTRNGIVESSEETKGSDSSTNQYDLRRRLKKEE